MIILAILLMVAIFASVLLQIFGTVALMVLGLVCVGLIVVNLLLLLIGWAE